MADFVVGGKVSIDPGNAPQTLKELKTAIRSAKDDLIAMQSQFGETSKEASNAAKKVAELEDKLGDAKQLVDAFNPDQKFKALGQSLNGVLGGFTALTGAMGLLGVESEEVQKQLLRVQSALALSQGLNQVGELTKQFGNLKAVLISTFGKSGAVGIVLAGVALIATAVVKLFDKTSASQKALKDSLKEYEKETENARRTILELTTAFELARDGVISKQDALKKYNETLGETYGKTNDVTEAEKIVVNNADLYIQIQGKKAQANLLFAKSAELSNKALLGEGALKKFENSPSFVVNVLKSKIDDQKAEAIEIDKIIKGLFVDISNLNSQLTFSSSRAASAVAGLGAAQKKPTKGGGGVKEAKELSSVIKTEAIKSQMDLIREREALDEKARRNFEQRQEEHYKILTGLFQAYNLQIGADGVAAAQKQLELEALQKQSAIDTANARIEAARAVSEALGALSDLIGKQTAAGKALGIAQATINMWIGVTEVLRSKSVLPEPFGTISKIANIATIIATGINAIKNIAKVQVPGGGGGSAPSAPIVPQSPQETRTRLNQNQINQIGNATVRAFVVESDIQNNRERITRLNRAARL